MHALIGENGVGKSTPLKILSGIEQPGPCASDVTGRGSRGFRGSLSARERPGADLRVAFRRFCETATHGIVIREIRVP